MKILQDTTTTVDVDVDPTITAVCGLSFFSSAAAEWVDGTTVDAAAMTAACGLSFFSSAVAEWVDTTVDAAAIAADVDANSQVGIYFLR